MEDRSKSAAETNKLRLHSFKKTRVTHSNFWRDSKPKKNLYSKEYPDTAQVGAQFGYLAASHAEGVAVRTGHVTVWGRYETFPSGPRHNGMGSTNPAVNFNLNNPAEEFFFLFALFQQTQVQAEPFLQPCLHECRLTR
eukprot:1160628-Pelagomonas_calceolata.AAC.24